MIFDIKMFKFSVPKMKDFVCEEVRLKNITYVGYVSTKILNQTDDDVA